jgi:RimJ/RimL family protein N-acetyltransferase
VTELETARLLLRPWREEDLDPYAHICTDPEVMQYMSGTMTRYRTTQQMERWMHNWEERGFGLWAVQKKATRAFIGRIGLLYHGDWPEAPEAVDSVQWGNS